MVHVPSAWRALRKLAKSDEAKEVLGYTIETPCVTCVGGQSAASYWRTGGYIPGKERPLKFSITPLFNGDLNAKERDTFFQQYRLDTDCKWIDIRTDEVYIKGDESTEAAAPATGRGAAVEAAASRPLQERAQRQRQRSSTIDLEASP